MSHDFSRFTQDPRKDYLGVLLQQGRPLTDADWNELVAQLARRAQADSYDTFGPAVVPDTTPDAFFVTPVAGGFTVDPGRIYVDGLLVQNHGSGADQWDAHLAELVGTAPVAYALQPWLPQPPALPTGPYIVYLDVWQRELGPLQDPALLEKALGGVDTTARWQTVWQVRALEVPGGTDCATPVDTIAAWNALVAPSGGRLTTATGNVAGEPDPCLVPPAGGYKGGENQLYRIEVHDGGAPGTATFKWSRDNASVQARVLALPDLTHIVVDSIGRDEVLGFGDGDWIEIVDDAIELGGPVAPASGVMRRILVGGGVDAATRTITLADALPAGLIPVDAQGVPTGDRHPRIRRWDQRGLVRRLDGTTYQDLDAIGSPGTITVPADATQLLLESGVLVSFGVDAPGGIFRAGDWWVAAARTVDASLEILGAAPPRGVHHHYAKLAVVTPPGTVEDCRQHWPPETGCCTVVVRPGESIQGAIDALPPAGGCVCLKNGVHVVTQTIAIDRSSVQLHGEAPGAIIQADGLALVLAIGAKAAATDICVSTLDLVVTQSIQYPAFISIAGERIRVEHCRLRHEGDAASLPTGIQVIGGDEVALVDNDLVGCALGIVAAGGTSALRVEGNRLQGLAWTVGASAGIVGAVGVQLGETSGAQCRGNRIEDFLVGVSVSADADTASVCDNDIRRRPLPAEIDTGVPPEQMAFAIEAGALGARIAGNRIDLASQNYGGIVVQGLAVVVDSNRIESSYGGTPSQGPIGIYAGLFEAGDEGFGAGVLASVRGNQVVGTLCAGIYCRAADGSVVEGNTVAGAGVSAIGIGLAACHRVLVSGNEIGTVVFGLVAGDGAGNRMEANSLTSIAFGALLNAEDSLAFAGNDLADVPGAGVFATDLVRSLRIANCRLANCGHASTAAAFGVAVGQSDPTMALALTVEDCEIVDVGVAPDGVGHAAGAACGIAAAFVTDLRVAGNRVAYTNVLVPDAALEHRALVASGTWSYSVSLGGIKIEYAFGAAQVVDNFFSGPGLSHLVELQHTQFSDILGLRFQKVIVANNRCDHWRAAGVSQEASLLLFGSQMIVTGNSVKGAPQMACIDLQSRPTALTSNVTTGPYLGATSVVPTPLASFNIQT